MNDVKPTIKDVAQLAGVSRATVSRVINDLPGVCEPMRNRVRQAVTQLGYQPNEIAQALASGRRPRSCGRVKGARPTIEDVARLAEVSRATVSRVINDLPGVCEPMRNRVRQAVTQLGYQPNEVAQALASKRRPRSCDRVSNLKPTIEEVARLAGVSRGNVSRVINDAPDVCGPIRNGARQAVSQLGYRPNEAGRALAACYYPDLSPGARPYYSRVPAKAATADGRTPTSCIFDIPSLVLSALDIPPAAEQAQDHLDRTSLDDLKNPNTTTTANIDVCGASQRRANV